MGRIRSQKEIKMAAIHHVLKLAWARYEKFIIFEMEDKILLFEFEHDEDKNHILDMSPLGPKGTS